MELITLQYSKLSEKIIGIACQRSRTITLNTPHKDINYERSGYYIAMLENALINGFDCILEYEGSDVIRKISVAI